MTTTPDPPGAIAAGSTSTATFEVVPLDELFDNHDEFSGEPTGALAGRSYRAVLDGGATLELAFAAETVRWSAGGAVGDDPYEAIAVRQAIFSITVSRLAERASALAVLDLQEGRIAVVVSRLVGEGDRVREDTRVIQGALDGREPRPMPRTSDLAGLRVHYRYSTTHAFEHIYVDPDHYVWHGIEGPEAGMGGFEPAEAYAVADRLYLFTWHERASPFNGAILIDLRERRSIGRLFGWHLDKSEAMQVATGARATVLNRTSYEGL